MAFSLIPREEKFFDLFEQQAKSLESCATIFKELVLNRKSERPGVDALRDLEHECDMTTHEIMDKLNRTFVTPLDREDIHELAKELDDVIDIIQAISERMALFRVERVTEDLIELAGILEEAVFTMAKAVGSIRQLNRPRRVLDYCIEIDHQKTMQELSKRTRLWLSLKNSPGVRFRFSAQRYSDSQHQRHRARFPSI